MFLGFESTLRIKEGEILSLVDFDSNNPNASSQERNLFYQACNSQIDGNNELAKDYYNKLLRKIPSESTSLYNLSLM